MPLGEEPRARHFPQRNRLVSGLSLGVVVIEAALHSGSLITARLAAEQGRQVFAVPGSPLDGRCRGSNNLLRDGAILCEGPDDVVPVLLPMIEGHALSKPTARRPAPMARAPRITPNDDPILPLLGPTAVDIDELVRQCQRPAPDVLIALAELELTGQIERVAGNRIQRVLGVSQKDAHQH